MKKIKNKNTFIIAEISSNHNNNFLEQKNLLKQFQNWCCAVKFQTFEPMK